MTDKKSVSEKHMDDMLNQSKYFQAFANPLRLCIMYKLLENDELCVTDFCDCMEASQPLISKHLHQLKGSGLVDSHSEGQHVWYKLKDEKVKDILGVMQEINEK